MEFSSEHGTVLRITFDVVYQDGSLKTVSMSMADDQPWSNAGIIALNEEAVADLLQPALASRIGMEAAQVAVSSYEKVQEGEDYKPAILVVHNDGQTTVKCGGHRGRGHAIATFM